MDRFGAGEWALVRARRNGATAAEDPYRQRGVAGRRRAVRRGREAKEFARAAPRHSRVHRPVVGDRVDRRTSSRDRSPDFVAHTVGLARLTAADPWSGLPDPALHPSSWPNSISPITIAVSSMPTGRLRSRAKPSTRQLQLDPRIKNSEGAEFDSGFYQSCSRTVRDSAGEYEGTSFSLSVAPIAQSDDGAMQWTLVHGQSSLRQARRCGRGRRDRGEARAATARRAQDQDHARAGGLRSRHGGGPVTFARRRGVGTVALQRRIVSARQARRAGRVAKRDDCRRWHDGGRMGSKPFDGEGLATSRKAWSRTACSRPICSIVFRAQVETRNRPVMPPDRSAKPPTVSPTNLYLEPGPYRRRKLSRRSSKASTSPS